jgi:hypothetical protein
MEHLTYAVYAVLIASERITRLIAMGVACTE